MAKKLPTYTEKKTNGYKNDGEVKEADIIMEKRGIKLCYSHPVLLVLCIEGHASFQELHSNTHSKHGAKIGIETCFVSHSDHPP